MEELSSNGVEIATPNIAEDASDSQSAARKGPLETETVEKLVNDNPAAYLTLFYLPHCPHCKLALRCLEELKTEDPRYQAVAIDMIDESKQKALANSYDYYYVPCFFLGKTKLFEGHMEKDDVKAVLDEALQALLK